MANAFTPEQISQILEEFFKTVGTRQYIGMRYVPLFGRKDETSIEWDNTKPYEPLTVVIYQGNSFTSRQYVPAGVDITNEAFWALTFNFNAQVEQYRRETARALQAAQGAQGDIDTLLPKADFSAENTVKDYIYAAQQSADNAQLDIDTLLPKSSFSENNTVKNYIDKVSKVFNNASEMQNDANLAVNSYYETSGFYASGDGGNAIYLISNEGNANGFDVLACQNNLVAILQTNKNNPVCYGADPTGTNDSSAQINYCITKNHNGNIVFPFGTYYLQNSIELDYMLDYATCVDFGNSNLISIANNYAIGIGTENFQSDVPSGGDFNKDRRICFIENFHLSTTSYYGVCIERNFLNVHLEHFEIETTQNGICVGIVHENLSARPTDAYIHDFCITNKDMSKDYTGIIINNTDNKISDGRIYGFKKGMYGIINFVDQVHFLATNLPNDSTFQMSNDWCCIVANSYSPIITNCYCDSIPCFFKPTSRCDFFTIDNLYVYSYDSSIMSEASIFNLTDLASVTAPRINITNSAFINGSYPNDAKFIELPNIPTMSDGSATFLKDANLSGNKITNMVYNPSLANEMWRKQVTIPFRNRWYASSTASIGSFVKMGRIIAPRSEDIILELQAFNSLYASRIRVAKASNQITITNSENLTAAPYSANLEYKFGTNNDGYIDVYIRVRNAVTPSNYTITKLLSTFAIVIPSYTSDAPQSMPSYTSEQIADMYTYVTDLNIS